MGNRGQKRKNQAGHGRRGKRPPAEPPRQTRAQARAMDLLLNPAAPLPTATAEGPHDQRPLLAPSTPPGSLPIAAGTTTASPVTSDARLFRSQPVTSQQLPLSPGNPGLSPTPLQPQPGPQASTGQFLATPQPAAAGAVSAPTHTSAAAPTSGVTIQPAHAQPLLLPQQTGSSGSAPPHFSGVLGTSSPTQLTPDHLASPAGYGQLGQPATGHQLPPTSAQAHVQSTATPGSTTSVQLGQPASHQFPSSATLGVGQSPTNPGPSTPSQVSQPTTGTAPLLPSTTGAYSLASFTPGPQAAIPHTAPSPAVPVTSTYNPFELGGGPLLSICEPLGTSVSTGTKEKIAKGEFVELDSLIDRRGPNPPPPNLTFTMDQSGQLQVTDTRKKTQINTILAWTDAFLVFASVFLAAHPARSQELLKYMHVIRMAAARFPGRGWLEYDRQFRMRQQSHPTRAWSVIDGELWALYVAAPGQSYLGSGGFWGNQPAAAKRFRSFRSQSRPARRSNTGVCYAYNRASGCAKTQCTFPHKCSTCQATGHGAFACKAPPTKGITARP